MKLSHIPVRVVTGAFILNSGLSQQGLERRTAEARARHGHGCLTRSNPPTIHHRTLL